MTSRRILTELYESKELAEVIRKLRPEHLQEDIRQHVFMELFEKPDDFIMDLHERRKLKAYIAKILWNTATYSRTTFAKAMGREDPTDFNEDHLIEHHTSEDYRRFKDHSGKIGSRLGDPELEYMEEEKERIEQHRSVVIAVSKVYWYKARVLELYAELGSYKAVSEKTGIPLTSVFMTIKEVRKEIKQKL